MFYTYSIRVFSNIFLESDIYTFLRKIRKKFERKVGKLNEIELKSCLYFRELKFSYVKHADMWKLCNRSYIVLLESSIIIVNLTRLMLYIKCSVSMTLDTSLPEGESVFSRSSYFRRLIHRQFLIPGPICSRWRRKSRLAAKCSPSFNELYVFAFIILYPRSLDVRRVTKDRISLVAL